jgi:hypothetical protein
MKTVARAVKSYRPTRAEQETTFRWDLEGRVIHVWSAQPEVWRKMARLGVVERRAPSTQAGRVIGRWYVIPLTEFRWGTKRKGGGGRGNPGALARFRQANTLVPSDQGAGHERPALG